jgi:hypothetical protein
MGGVGKMSESNNKFAVWKNVGRAFAGIGGTTSDIGWRVVIGFLFIFVITEIVGFATEVIYAGDVVGATYSFTAQFQGIFTTLVWFVVLAPFGIAIHRSVLLFEKPTVGYIRSIFEKRSLRFAITGLVLYFIALLFPSLMIAASHGSMLPDYFIVVAVAWMWIAGFFIGRICILLPAIAVDERYQKIRAAWDATRGNTWRIWFAIVVCTLPFQILYNVLARIKPNAVEDMAIALLFDLFVALIMCVQILVSIRLVSLLYKNMTEEPSTNQLDKHE